MGRQFSWTALLMLTVLSQPATVWAQPDQQVCTLRLSQMPPTRTRVHLNPSKASADCLSQSFEWDPDVASAMERMVLMPDGASCDISISADRSFVSSNATRYDIGWYGSKDGGPAPVSKAKSTIKIWGDRPIGGSEGRPVARISVDCPTSGNTNSTGLELAFKRGADASSGVAGRAFGGTTSGILTDVVWAATRVALARIERLALERIRTKVKSALGCGNSGAKLAKTCAFVDSVRFSQLDTAGSALVRAFKADVIDLVAAKVRGKKANLAKALLESLDADAQPRVIMAALANSLPCAKGQAPPKFQLCAHVRAAAWCLARVDCSVEELATSGVKKAFKTTKAKTSQALYELMVSARNGSKRALESAIRRVVRELLGKRHQLLAIFSSDWSRAIPALCGSIATDKDKCTQVLGPLTAALTPIVEAAKTPAHTAEDRETRRVAIASAIERVAEIQTARSERPDESIVSIAASFDAGGQVVPWDWELRAGATLGVAFDGPASSGGSVWLHAMIGLIDTTQIVVSELQSEGADDNDDAFVSDLEWSNVFLPSARIGLGLGSRELPATIWVGLGAARGAEAVRAAIQFGVSLTVPLIDLN